MELWDAKSLFPNLMLCPVFLTCCFCASVPLLLFVFISVYVFLHLHKCVSIFHIDYLFVCCPSTCLSDCMLSCALLMSDTYLCVCLLLECFLFVTSLSSPISSSLSSSHLSLGTLSKRGRQRQRREARRIFLRNPRISLSISLLWLPCMFLFSLKFRWLQRLFLNERMDAVSSWNVGHVRQRGNEAVEVSFESRTAQISALFHIFTCAFCLV